MGLGRARQGRGSTESGGTRAVVSTSRPRLASFSAQARWLRSTSNPHFTSRPGIGMNRSVMGFFVGQLFLSDH